MLTTLYWTTRLILYWTKGVHDFKDKNAFFQNGSTQLTRIYCVTPSFSLYLTGWYRWARGRREEARASGSGICTVWPSGTADPQTASVLDSTYSLSLAPLPPSETTSVQVSWRLSEPKDNLSEIHWKMFLDFDNQWMEEGSCSFGSTNPPSCRRMVVHSL